VATYSGAWARQRLPSQLVPLQAPVDPEHLTPSNLDDRAPGQQPLWSTSVHAPTLPDELAGHDPSGVIEPGGPVDSTPADPNLGIAGGNGLTTLEAQALRGLAHSQDFGAVAAHQWQPQTDRFDGSGPHVEIIPDTIGDGDSPSTVDLRYRTGVGAASDDGNSRLAKRQKRWWDRVIDFHRWPVTYRPRIAVNARTPSATPPVASGGQLVSPFPALVWTGTPDRFVAPQERRTPGPWDEPLQTDPMSAGPYALGSWGL